MMKEYQLQLKAAVQGAQKGEEMNSVVLIGRLVRDPEVRYTAATQMAVANFTLAVNRPKRQDAEQQADFPRVTVFGRQAENCERYLAKGLLVGIQGRLQTGSYQDRDGITRYTTDVIADRVEFLQWANGDDRTSGRNTATGDAAPPQNYAGSQQNYDGQQEELNMYGAFQAIDEDVPF